MRTKLRLDLKDVRKQIEDMEELLKSDKSEENIEAHSKLVEYEKKLQEQYEKMTGLSHDQATNLATKGDKIAEAKKPTFSLFLSFVGSLLLVSGFYNTLLHSLNEFGPTAAIDYFSGTGGSSISLQVFVSSMTYDISFYLVVGPFLAGSFLVLLGGVVDSSRSAFLGLLEGLGFVLTNGFLAYVLFTAGNPLDGANYLQSNLLILAATVLAGGVFLLIVGITNSGIPSKLLGIIIAGLVLYSGVQLYLLTSLSDAEQATKLVQNWPWISFPLIGAAILNSLLKFVKILK